jgi:hypothetical protein
LLLRRNDVRQALISFERAAAIDPTSSFPWSHIVMCCIQLKDWRKAATALETLVMVDAEKAWSLAERINKFHLPDPALNRAVATVLAHKEDNAESPDQSSAPHAIQHEYFVIGVPTGDSLNVRSGPGMNYGGVFKLANGVGGIEITGKPVMNGQTEWVPIRFQGSRGWARGKYLKLFQSP